MNDIYIRFMAPITPHSTERLFNIFDAALRSGANRFHLLLNSPGGSVSHGLAIHNYFKGLSIELNTYNFGTVDSIGVIIYCAGSRRFSVPHARFMLHPVAMTFGAGQTMDEHGLRERQNGLNTDQQNIAKVISATVNKPEQDILDMIHRRQTFDSDAAMKFGLVESIESALIPAGVDVQVVRESEANMPHQFQHQMSLQPVRLSPAPLSGATDAYNSNPTFTKVF